MQKVSFQELSLFMKISLSDRYYRVFHNRLMTKLTALISSRIFPCHCKNLNFIQPSTTSPPLINSPLSQSLTTSPPHNFTLVHTQFHPLVHLQGFLYEFMGTLVLVITVLATINGARGQGSNYLQPLSIGLAIFVIHLVVVRYHYFRNIF